MPLEVAQTPRLYEVVAEQVAAAIRAGEFRLGDRLPAERELARQCGVGRPTVREAILALEIAGVLEVRGGSGVFVRAVPSPLRRVAQSTEAPFEAFAARRVIEAETAALAAERRTAEDLAALHAALKAMRDERVRGPGPDLNDKAFHLAVARATKNDAFVRIVEFVWETLLYPGPLWARLRERRSIRPSRLAEHAAILQAIELRDPVAARAAMLRHFDGAVGDFLEMRSIAGGPAAAGAPAADGTDGRAVPPERSPHDGERQQPGRRNHEASEGSLRG
jgi:DNA-binding FadR family transcriptional regulator